MFVAPEKTLKLTTNDMLRKHLKRGNEPLPVGKEIVAGGISGLIQSMLSTPMELLKTNMQDAGRLAAMNAYTMHNVQTISARKVAKHLFGSSGIRGFFRGFGVTGGLNVFFSIMHFPTFFTLMR